MPTGVRHSVEMKDEAWKKVDEIKKDLGDKWDEVTGKKS